MQIIGGEVTDIYLINKVVCLSTSREYPTT